MSRSNGPRRRRSVTLPYAIGDVSPNGDLLQAVVLIEQRISEKGAHLLLVAPSGSVYTVMAWENKAEMLAEQFPDWVAGTFNARASFEDIAVDLAETYALLHRETGVAA